MKQYGWIIDVDNVDKREGRIVKTMGPRGTNPVIMRRLIAGEGTPFRMYDDDGNLYYEGRIIDDRPDDYVVPPDESACFGFEPLDDYGGPNAGCTEIHYKDADGEWRQL